MTFVDEKGSEQLQERAWEAVDSLMRTLGSTLDVTEVARRSLLTVTGQLLVRKAALYLFDSPTETLRLCECAGIRRERIEMGPIPANDSIYDLLEQDGVIISLESVTGIPDVIGRNFEHITCIADGEEPLGLLVFGGRISEQSDPRLDERLLRSLGLVIGSTIRRSQIHQETFEAHLRLQGAQRMQQQILDHVSHEFNTPLMVLRSTADFLATASPEEIEEIRTMQMDSVERLEALVRGILTMAESTSEARTSPIGQRNLVENLLQPAVASSSWTSGLRREAYWIAPTGGLDIDPQGLQAAFVALLSNAWMFSGQHGGRLGVRTYPTSRDAWVAATPDERLGDSLDFLRGDAAEIVEEAQGNRVKTVEPNYADLFVIEIIDDGIGIPSAEIDLVMQPFTQATNSPTREITGAGMGLPTARKRVMDMGGEFDLTSAVDYGTVASILLPIVRQDLD